MAVFDDFRKVCAFLGVERHRKEIVEDQELRFSSFLSSVSIVPLFWRFSGFPSVWMRSRTARAYRPCMPRIPMLLPDSFCPYRTACDEQVFTFTDKVQRCETLHLITIRATRKVIVNLRHRRVVVSEVCVFHRALNIACGPVVPFSDNSQFRKLSGVIVSANVA